MTAVRRTAVATLVAASTLLCSCGVQTRRVERETVVIDGRHFLCSKTVNRLSGNESEPQCAPIGP